MRVIIWCDMEGIAGIEAWEQVMGGSPLYEEGRRLFTGEVSAAVRGAKAGGATEIIVVDCHGAGGAWSFKSLIPERLESGAEYVFGYPWARYITPLEDGCDAALFVGAHAMAGTPDGILCHTVSSEAWYNATINDTPVGESGILAAVCGCWDVPAIFVAGDEATCREVQQLLGEKVVTAPVKKGLGRFAARTLNHADACTLIEERVAQALRNHPDWATPWKPTSPVTFRVELATPDRANAFLGRTGVEIAGPRTVISHGTNFWQAWDQFWYRT
ncbi:MAG TPA: M55 family metallopeptidase [Ktedonosporobacter sp.]|nr:M55 family metallopeptidase [Ktedonosporobacter sp.]